MRPVDTNIFNVVSQNDTAAEAKAQRNDKTMRVSSRQPRVPVHLRGTTT